MIQHAQIVAVANDITFSSGAFGPREDAAFLAATEYAVAERLPLIYLAANSGARVGLANEIKKCMQVHSCRLHLLASDLWCSCMITKRTRMLAIRWLFAGIADRKHATSRQSNGQQPAMPISAWAPCVYKLCHCS